MLEEKRKRVVIIHGWDATPKDHWIPWLRKNLKDVDTIAPQMPDTSYPKIDAWVSHLKKTVGKIDENTYFVAFSIGCQALLRHLAETGETPGGAILLAPWMKLKPGSLDDKEDKETVREWEKTPLNFSKISDFPSVAILSEDDPFVSMNQGKIFKDGIKAKIMKVKNMGHFNRKEVPVVLSSLLGMLS